jgi:hypothetical protein
MSKQVVKRNKDWKSRKNKGLAPEELEYQPMKYQIF